MQIMKRTMKKSALSTLMSSVGLHSKFYCVQAQSLLRNTTSALRLPCFLALSVGGGLTVSAADAPKPYPLEYWAMRPVISGVEVSPDGKRLALLRIPSRGANPILEIYDAADLQKKPFRMNADPMELEWFSWVTDTHILFGARRQVRERIKGFNQGTFKSKIVFFDIESKKMQEFSTERPAALVNVLPRQPNKVILAMLPESGKQRRVNYLQLLDYYEFDLKKNTKKLLIQGTASRFFVEFDADGNPWVGGGFDWHKGEYVLYHRQRGSKKWKEIYRIHEDNFEAANVGIGGFDVDDPDKLYIIANNGHNTTGLWELSVSTGTLEPVYQRKDVNVGGVLRSSNTWADPDRVVGLSYYTDRLHREFFDEVEGATLHQLAGIVPHAHNVSINSRSRDGATLTVFNVGPRDPGTYYLLKDGRFNVVGSRLPNLESEKLADVEYISYPSRDGKTIPAFLTVPHGKPPFPLVVMPHGGPFVPETVSFDRWAQLLANNGYMVLQPQYRGSTNFGLDFYQAAFLTPEGGQGGYKMQDDKDDGAKYLVKVGKADPDRLAMMGWSYGGYAAAVAAARTPQIYQCVVAGASVFDALMQLNYYRFLSWMRGAVKLEQIKMWDDSISPIKEVAKVNVPMLIVHGTADQRVPVEHAEKYMKELDKYGKTYKYVELVNADHWTNTLTYDHQNQFFGAMIDFLANDCGPGGL